MKTAIKARRKALKLSQEVLAERSGISRSYIAEIEAGKKHPNTRRLEQLARALDCTPADLIEPDTRAREVPLLSWIAAGALAEHDEITDEMILGIQPVVGLPDGDWIAFKVDGISMNKISPPESVIFVNKAERNLVPNACYVVADIDGSATYKRYRPDPDRFEAVSTSDDFNPIIIDNTPHIIGRVRRTMLDM